MVQHEGSRAIPIVLPDDIRAIIAALDAASRSQGGPARPGLRRFWAEMREAWRTRTGAPASWKIQITGLPDSAVASQAERMLLPAAGQPAVAAVIVLQLADTAHAAAAGSTVHWSVIEGWGPPPLVEAGGASQPIGDAWLGRLPVAGSGLLPADFLAPRSMPEGAVAAGVAGSSQQAKPIMLATLPVPPAAQASESGTIGGVHLLATDARSAAEPARPGERAASGSAALAPQPAGISGEVEARAAPRLAWESPASHPEPARASPGRGNPPSSEGSARLSAAVQVPEDTAGAERAAASAGVWVGSRAWAPAGEGHAVNDRGQGWAGDTSSLSAWGDRLPRDPGLSGGAAAQPPARVDPVTGSGADLVSLGSRDAEEVSRAPVMLEEQFPLPEPPLRHAALEEASGDVPSELRPGPSAPAEGAPDTETASPFDYGSGENSDPAGRADAQREPEAAPPWAENAAIDVAVPVVVPVPLVEREPPEQADARPLSVEGSDVLAPQDGMIEMPEFDPATEAADLGPDRGLQPPGQAVASRPMPETRSDPASVPGTGLATGLAAPSPDAGPPVGHKTPGQDGPPPAVPAGVAAQALPEGGATKPEVDPAMGVAGRLPDLDADPPGQRVSSRLLPENPMAGPPHGLEANPQTDSGAAILGSVPPVKHEPPWQADAMSAAPPEVGAAMPPASGGGMARLDEAADAGGSLSDPDPQQPGWEGSLRSEPERPKVGAPQAAEGEPGILLAAAGPTPDRPFGDDLPAAVKERPVPAGGAGGPGPALDAATDLVAAVPGHDRKPPEPEGSSHPPLENPGAAPPDGPAVARAEIVPAAAPHVDPQHGSTPGIGPGDLGRESFTDPQVFLPGPLLEADPSIDLAASGAMIDSPSDQVNRLLSMSGDAAARPLPVLDATSGARPGGGLPDGSPADASAGPGPHGRLAPGEDDAPRLVDRGRPAHQNETMGIGLAGAEDTVAAGILPPDVPQTQAAGPILVPVPDPSFDGPLLAALAGSALLPAFAGASGTAVAAAAHATVGDHVFL